MALHGGLSFCKTQQVVGFDCGGIERLSVPQPNNCLLLGEPICIVFLQHSSMADTHSYCNVLQRWGPPCSYQYRNPPHVFGANFHLVQNRLTSPAFPIFQRIALIGRHSSWLGYPVDFRVAKTQTSRCVESLNISVEVAKCGKFSQIHPVLAQLFIYYKNDQSCLKNLFMVRFQLMQDVYIA